jgi:hypothetical protein
MGRGINLQEANLGNDNNTNQQNITQDALDQLKADLETEKGKAASLVQEATKPLAERIASLEADLKVKGEEVEASRKVIVEKDSNFASLSTQAGEAVKAYREQVLKINPLLPADMVAGVTVAEINASAEKAAALVESIKRGLQANDLTVKVPAGSPGRTPLDTSNMSTKEKITYGLEQSRKRTK